MFVTFFAGLFGRQLTHGCLPMRSGANLRATAAGMQDSRNQNRKPAAKRATADTEGHSEAAEYGQPGRLIQKRRARQILSVVSLAYPA
jgi:hypothetical protein